MSSTAKSLELLNYFSERLPEIGLSQFCKLVKRDKATTYRHLQALEKGGLVEQNPLNKKYRLGPGLLLLAKMRELTVPRQAGVVAALTELANSTGETAHVSILSGATLYTSTVVESPKYNTRAIIEHSTLPLHATASGICALSFGAAELTDIALQNLQAYTPHTPTSKDDLLRAIKSTLVTGFSQANRTFDNEINGFSTPIFDHTGLLAGAVSVACVASRFDAQSEQNIKFQLTLASRKISRNWGGRIPPQLDQHWSELFSSNQIVKLRP